MTVSHVQAAEIRALYRHHFASFVRFAFAACYPVREFIPTWHVDVLAAVLQECVEGKIRRLIANLPPRHLKSFCASVTLPAWILGRDPSAAILSISGNKGLTFALDEDARALMQHPRYRSLFPQATLFPTDQDILLKQRGYRRAFTVQNPLVGLGADFIIIDDPLSPSDSGDPRKLERVNRWYDQNILQRLNNQETGGVIVIMQRVHPNDLTGHLLKQPGWTHLCLPAVATQDESFTLPLGEVVGRRKGEALQPERLSVQKLRESLMGMRASSFMAQYQQAPFISQRPDERRSTFYSDLKVGERWRPEHGTPRIELLRWVPELQFVLHEVFGEGEHPAPPNMRVQMELDEWIEFCAWDDEQRKSAV